jgi:hypothetical protein
MTTTRVTRKRRRSKIDIYPYIRCKMDDNLHLGAANGIIGILNTLLMAVKNHS